MPAIKPDVVLLHAQQADELGNVQYRAPVFFDVLMAQAAKHVIVSVDRIVSHETVRKSHALTRLSSAFVDTIVEAPYGAHPTVSAGLYDLDEAHVAEYVKASASATSFKDYLGRYVHGCDGPSAYRRQIGDPAFLEG